MQPTDTILPPSVPRARPAGVRTFGKQFVLREKRPVFVHCVSFDADNWLKFLRNNQMTEIRCRAIINWLRILGLIVRFRFPSGSAEGGCARSKPLRGKDFSRCTGRGTLTAETCKNGGSNRRRPNRKTAVKPFGARRRLSICTKGERRTSGSKAPPVEPPGDSAPHGWKATGIPGAGHHRSRHRTKTSTDPRNAYKVLCFFLTRKKRDGERPQGIRHSCGTSPPKPERPATSNKEENTLCRSLTPSQTC